MKYLKQKEQLLCDRYVLLDYYDAHDNQCSNKLIAHKIEQIMNDYPAKNVYIGVTHHPCQRFTGDKENTTPLPSSLNFNYEFGDEELITEEAHNESYEKMFLICYRRSKKMAFSVETLAIKIAREIDAGRVKNSSKGGNGNLAESEYYWLYVCISSFL